jgi:hypothetical protein
MKMTTAAVKTLFANNGMSEDLPLLAPITLEQYSRLIRMAERWFGVASTEELMDCFDPEGESVEPGYEDSVSHYRFRFSSWEEFAEE